MRGEGEGDEGGNSDWNVIHAGTSGSMRFIIERQVSYGGSLESETDYGSIRGFWARDGGRLDVLFRDEDDPIDYSVRTTFSPVGVLDIDEIDDIGQRPHYPRRVGISPIKTSTGSNANHQTACYYGGDIYWIESSGDIRKKPIGSIGSSGGDSLALRQPARETFIELSANFAAPNVGVFAISIVSGGLPWRVRKVA